MDLSNGLRIRLKLKDIPALMKCIDDPGVQFSDKHDAIIALGKLGVPALQSLFKLTKHRHPGFRQFALQAIKAIEPLPTCILPRLIHLLEDSDPQVKMEALKVVIKVKQNLNRKFEPAIDAILSSPDTNFKTDALNLILATNNLGFKIDLASISGRVQ